ncbi:type II secretion system GspH family protein [Oceanimonas sp. NS1]|nr:type II secretion system GspH family protein [Oceanimonas sp. NS1]
MKARGFTLLELVIVMVLIGISAVFGTRFIAYMAEGYMGNTERAQALAGARFTLERLRRELALAYGPSVYFSDSDRCISFVPTLAAGTYRGSAKSATASFVVPLSLQKQVPQGSFMAIRAASGEALWSDFPAAAPDDNVHLVQKAYSGSSFGFDDVFNDPTLISFDREGFDLRYTLIRAEQVRYCATGGSLFRQVKTGADWGDGVLMLTGLTSERPFLDYDESNQLVQLQLILSTRDGELVLPGQLQVTYAP